VKRSAALREQEYWAVTTPADRARIQQKITEAIREAKTRPDQFSTAYPESHENARSKEGGSGKRLRDISEGSSRRGVSLGRELSQRSEKWASVAKEKIRPNPDAELWKGVAAGMAAGLVGTLAMTGFMGLWNKTGELLGGDLEERARRQQQEQRGEEEPAAADLSQAVFHKRLDAATKKAVGNAVAYGFGSAVGALYGVLSELYPSVSAGHGAVYGTTVWLGADQLALPALGYAPGINEHPVNEHIYGAAAHAVYGVVTEKVRDVLRSWLD